MFWERFVSLCDENNTNPTRIGNEIGVKSSSVFGWKKGGMPSNENLIKIAALFSVSTDYLLGCSDDRYPPALANGKAPTPEGAGGRNLLVTIGRDGSYSETYLTDEQLKAYRAMIDLLPDATDERL